MFQFFKRMIFRANLRISNKNLKFQISKISMSLFFIFECASHRSGFVSTCCSCWKHSRLLPPPLLSSVPTLPEDSVGEADDIMGIFDRWSSIILILKMFLRVMTNDKLYWKSSCQDTMSTIDAQKVPFGFFLQQKKCFRGTEMWICQASGGQMVGWVPLRSHYCVAASGVEMMQMGWGPAMSSSSLHFAARQQVVLLSSLRQSSGSVTVCGCSSVAAPQKGAQGGWVGRWRGGGLAPRAV